MLSDKLYELMDKGPLRALSLVLAFALAFCVFWDPTRFAAATSSLEVWQEVFIVWAVCTGVIHGVGFALNRCGCVLFAPLPAIVILATGLFYFSPNFP